MPEFNRRLRRLQLLRLRFQLRQQREARVLAELAIAFGTASSLLEELNALRSHYVEIESALGMPAQILGSIRRKLGELALAHTEQRRQVAWLDEQRLQSVAAIQSLRLRLEHIDQVMAETRRQDMNARELAETLMRAPRTHE